MRYCQCGSEIKNTDIEQRIKHIFGSEYTEQLPSNMISPNYELQQFIKYNTLCSNCIDMKDLKAYLTSNLLLKKTTTFNDLNYPTYALKFYFGIALNKAFNTNKLYLNGIQIDYQNKKFCSCGNQIDSQKIASLTFNRLMDDNEKLYKLDTISLADVKYIADNHINCHECLEHQQPSNLTYFFLETDLNSDYFNIDKNLSEFEVRSAFNKYMYEHDTFIQRKHDLEREEFERNEAESNRAAELEFWDMLSSQDYPE